MNFDNTYVKIDLDAIEANIDAIRAKVQVDVMTHRNRVWVEEYKR